eukprot:4382255-Pleurochrysis_carterae.AAC.1
MGIVYDLLKLTMMETTQDGAYLLDTFLHIFESVADEHQPLFKAYNEQEINEEMVRLQLFFCVHHLLQSFKSNSSSIPPILFAFLGALA